MNKTQEIIFAIFLIVALVIFFFPLIISIVTKNYWYFMMFFVSWIPALIIAQIGAAICD